MRLHLDRRTNLDLVNEEEVRRGSGSQTLEGMRENELSKK